MKLTNYLHFGFGALKANLSANNTPLSVMFSVTNRCTSKCSYCDIPLRKQRELSTQQTFRLIDEMGEAGVQKLSLWGGEPLLRDDIGELIQRAKAHGMCVNIDSNGYLVPDRLNDIQHLDFIILSFDGEQEYHDKNREPGAYGKFFKAVKAIDGRIPIWTLTVLTKYNINSVEFILKKAAQYGFYTMFQVPYHPAGIGSQEDILATANEYRAVFRCLVESKRDGAPIISSRHYLKCVSQWPFFPDTTRSESLDGMPRCWAGRLFCNIDTNGDMYPCSPMIHRVAPLNVTEMGFRTCFHALQKPQCRSCISACAIEANLVFSFDVPSIFEWSRTLRKRPAGQAL